MTDNSLWERRQCEHCGEYNVKLRRIIASNASVRFVWICLDCNRHARRASQSIPHEIIKGWQRLGRLPEDLTEIPVFSDEHERAICAVCGRFGAEWHHIAPRDMSDLFGEEWGRWPGVYLCVPHHILWHAVVTPYMSHVRNTEKAREAIERFYARVPA